MTWFQYFFTGCRDVDEADKDYLCFRVLLAICSVLVIIGIVVAMTWEDL